MRRARLSRRRAKNIRTEIIARAHYDDEVHYILERGADNVIMGEREIANSMLAMLKAGLDATPTLLTPQHPN